MTNLPAFDTQASAFAFHEKHAPGTHMETNSPWEPCKHCNCYHYKSTGRGPGGESSGQGRFSKHAKRGSK